MPSGAERHSVTDEEIEALASELAELLSTASQEQRQRFRYAIEDFQLPLSKAGKAEAARRLKEAIQELKQAKQSK